MNIYTNKEGGLQLNFKFYALVEKRNVKHFLVSHDINIQIRFAKA